uniref:Protein kinase domain-containing protein n=1 Tax=Acrobeloides nanus TaxID=290746 RepID=A0A914DF59_9BILA
MRSQQDWRIIDTEETALLSHHYQIADIIEKGPICTVYRAIHRNTSKTYTIKSIDVRKYNLAAGLSEKDIHKEVEICASLTHPFLCQLRDVIEGPNVVHMIFDYVEGSDICFEVVKRAGSGFVYSEAVASHYIRQLIEALQYMHSKNIVHRDIRPHNLLLSSKDNNASLKLRGSSIAIRLDTPDQKCPPGRVGIPHFMAPEVVANQDYDFQADMWSVGVLMYLLLSGKLPFTGSKEHVYECITEGKYSLHGSPWCYLSDAAKDLLTRLLTVDPKARFTAEQCLKHIWLADKTVPSRKHLNETVENIRQYNQRRKLKSNIIATVNNARWNKFPVYSFLSADSMPGGDACDSDCTQRGPEVSTSEDMVGVESVLSSLDQMAVLFDRSLVMDAATDDELQKALNDREFHEILLTNETLFEHIFSLLLPYKEIEPKLFGGWGRMDLE